MSSSLTPYLYFGGRCEEAVNFYRIALGAKLGMLMRFSESPDPVPEGLLQAGFEHKVMHADITIAGNHLMLSDGCDDKCKFSGFNLALSFPTEAEAHAAFDTLADGGNVQMPLGPTFWSPCFGMLTDRFGVGWMIMVPSPQGGSTA